MLGGYAGVDGNMTLTDGLLLAILVVLILQNWRGWIDRIKVTARHTAKRWRAYRQQRRLRKQAKQH